MRCFLCTALTSDRCPPFRFPNLKQSTVYAAYGDYLVIWDARVGTLVAKIKMPDPKTLLSPDGNSTDKKSESEYYNYDYYYQKPQIKSLVLEGGRLLVIMDGYGMVARTLSRVVDPIVSDYMSTHVRIYDVAALVSGSDDVVGTADLHGRFSEVRAIGSAAHVMTVSDVHADSYLVQPFQRWNYPWLTTDEEYIQYVNETAKEHAIPFFIDKLIQELVPDGKTLPNLARICLWQDEDSGTSLEQVAFSDGILNSLAQVNSIDIKSDDSSIDVSSAGAFLPSSWARFYGATDALVIAGQGWKYVPQSGTSIQATYFLGFSVDGASSAPHSVGKVDGYLLNNHAIDVVDNVLRVATSIRTSWIVRPVVLEDAAGQNATKEDEFIVEEVPSSTQNYIITLAMPGMDGSDSGMMKELGRLKLGKPDELFTAVRFFDNIAYAVTFERRDPLYVLDLNDPREPTILSELDITGFSSYIHSMNADNTLILALGQEADEFGTVLGIQITVFDARNPNNVTANVRYTIEESRDTYSHSRSLDDFKATRYAGDRLIIPIDVWGSYGSENTDSFHGFVTYFVNATTIQPECRIAHGQEEPQIEDWNGRSVCYYCASLPERSMIFDGNLMTMNNHFIRSSDMNTCQQIWSLDIVEDDDSAGCCGAFWGGDYW